MPLSGLRVIDLTRILAGSFCSMLLGDMGAEVIKIRRPAPDLGADTDDVLQELGYAPEDIKRLREAGVI
jgi:crotonobetainyl-CoA:carnitine CoA-transferase CaiB-like acyl-CoA transferase